MMTNCFQISDNLQLIPHDFEHAVNAIQQPDVKMWIDIQGFERDELEEKLNKLDVTGFGRKLCLEAHDRPGFYPMSTQLLLVIPVMAVTEELSEVQHVVLLARKNFLLTVRGIEKRGRKKYQIDVAESLIKGNVGRGADISEFLCRQNKPLFCWRRFW